SAVCVRVAPRNALSRETSGAASPWRAVCVRGAKSYYYHVGAEAQDAGSTRPTIRTCGAQSPEWLGDCPTTRRSLGCLTASAACIVVTVGEGGGRAAEDEAGLPSTRVRVHAPPVY